MMNDFRFWLDELRASFVSNIATPGQFQIGQRLAVELLIIQVDKLNETELAKWIKGQFEVEKSPYLAGRNAIFRAAIAKCRELYPRSFGGWVDGSK